MSKCLRFGDTPDTCRYSAAGETLLRPKRHLLALVYQADVSQLRVLCLQRQDPPIWRLNIRPCYPAQAGS